MKHSLLKTGLGRREFLATSMRSGLLLGFALTAPGLAPPAGADDPPAGIEPTIWFKIGTDGNVVVNITKAEMGQHVGTALARIVAEELGADWNSVSIVHVDTDPRWGDMITGGSWSVFTSFTTLAQAGAAGRQVLTEAGAALLGVDPQQCSCADGRVVAGNKQLGFGEIVRRGNIDRHFSADALAAMPVKPAAERRLIGHDMRALDIPEKTRGQAVYGLDAELPGMVYARPVLPPTRYGCTVTKVDDSQAKQVAGYMRYLILDDPSDTLQGWVLAIASTFPAASQAADALQVQWSAGKGVDIDEQQVLAEGQRLVDQHDSGALTVDDGDVIATRAAASRNLSSIYTNASALHFQLEPVNALAEVREGHLHVHCGNQWQSLILPTLAKASGMDEANITIHQYALGGGFGRRLWGDYMIPSILATQALGEPVKTIFTREDDSRLDCIRSPAVQRFDGSLDGDGRVTGLEHALAAGWPTKSMIPGFMFNALNGRKADPFSHSGADHWYSIPNQRVRAINNEVAHEAFLPGWLRAVGAGWIGWGLESFIDEMAIAAGQDPIAFRLQMLDGEGKNAGNAPEAVGGAKRLANVLKELQKRTQWGRKLPPGEGLGVAVSAGQERTMPTWVATVAHVAVSDKGEVDVRKIFSVIDCGTVIHPDGALAQAEGATLWGVSLALYEEAKLDGGQVSARNLGDYFPLRMADVPELDIHFLPSDEFPTGLGEPPMNAVAPAIGNAIFAATGKRVRDLPIRLS